MLFEYRTVRSPAHLARLYEKVELQILKTTAISYNSRVMAINMSIQVKA